MRADVVFNKGQWNTDQAIPWDFFHGERFFFILAPSFCLKLLKKSIPGWEEFPIFTQTWLSHATAELRKQQAYLVHDGHFFIPGFWEMWA